MCIQTIISLIALGLAMILFIAVKSMMHGSMDIIESIYQVSRYKETEAKLTAIYRFAPSPINLTVPNIDIDNHTQDTTIKLACCEFSLVCTFDNYEPEYALTIREIGDFLYKSVEVIIGIDSTASIEGLFNHNEDRPVTTELNDYILTYDSNTKELKIRKMVIQQ